MPIIRQEDWKKWVDANQTPYGKACVDVARRVMELLDENETPLKTGYFPDIATPHGLICKAANDSGAGGITGFQAGCVAEMVSHCHSRGVEFCRVRNTNTQIRNEGDIATEKGVVLNPALLSVEV